MTRANADVPSATTVVVVVDVPLSFTLSALCQASGAASAQVQALVAEGLLAPTGHGPAQWRFDEAALLQTRRALRLARDFELELAAVALVLDLLGEIDRLRARLPRP